MNIKRYFAADMRQALRMVREGQGPDAVILSNCRVDGGVEIVAAVDYDETLVARMRRSEGPEDAESPPLAATPGPREERAAEPDPVPDPRPESGWPPFSALDPADEAAPDWLSEPAVPTRRRRPPVSEPNIVWSQDPVLTAMREEVHALRGILEGQLSGLVWGELRQKHPLRATLLERLTRLGLSPELSQTLTDRISYGDDPEHNWRQALGLLAKTIPVTDDDILQQGGVVALVGPTGVGKTTTVAKLAARYALRHGPQRVALITTDSYRIGAHQQLRTYGKILGIPLHIADRAEVLQRILHTLREKPLVLIDTAGMSQRDVRLVEQAVLFTDVGIAVKTYAVLSATTQRVALDETVRALRRVALDGCILTKIDESTCLGEVLSVVSRHQLPVAYLSDGQRVPEDLAPARANNLVTRAVGLMQSHGEPAEEETLAAMFGGMASNAHG